MLAAVVVTNTAGSSLNYARISALICSSEASAIFRFLTRALFPKSRTGRTWLAIRRWRRWVVAEFKKRMIPRANPEGCIAAERAGVGAENTSDEVARGASKYTPS